MNWSVAAFHLFWMTLVFAGGFLLVKPALDEHHYLDGVYQRTKEIERELVVVIDEIECRVADEFDLQKPWYCSKKRGKEGDQ